MAGFRKGLLCLGANCSLTSPGSSICCSVLAAGSSVAFSPGNLSTSSSASSTLGSPENEEYILSFETIDKMRRVSSYSSLNSLIGELSPSCPSLLPLGNVGILAPAKFLPLLCMAGSLQWRDGEWELLAPVLSFSAILLGIQAQNCGGHNSFALNYL